MPRLRQAFMLRPRRAFMLRPRRPFMVAVAAFADDAGKIPGK
jgi:hypothetical protein